MAVLYVVFGALAIGLAGSLIFWGIGIIICVVEVILRIIWIPLLILFLLGLFLYWIS